MHIGGMINLNEIDGNFLDTNIMLSVPLNDSHKKDCQKYFDNNSHKYSSYTVIKESKNVIRKLLDISLRILMYTQNYILDNNVSDYEVTKFMPKIMKDFLKENSNLIFLLNFNEDRFNRLVKTLFHKYSFLIKTEMFKPVMDVLNDEISNVKKYYKNSCMVLNNLFKRIKTFTFKYDDSDLKLINHLQNHEIHSPDSKILVDAYKTSVKLKKRVSFITFDNGILNKSNFIEGFFNFQVIPSQLVC